MKTKSWKKIFHGMVFNEFDYRLESPNGKISILCKTEAEANSLLEKLILGKIKIAIERVEHEQGDAKETRA